VRHDGDSKTRFGHKMLQIKIKERENATEVGYITIVFLLRNIINLVVGL